MRIETRYGYLIDALRRYPFDKEIKERIEEITFPYQNFDENWFIKSKSASNTPEALKNIILKENDPELIRRLWIIRMPPDGNRYRFERSCSFLQVL